MLSEYSTDTSIAARSELDSTETHAHALIEHVNGVVVVIVGIGFYVSSLLVPVRLDS